MSKLNMTGKNKKIAMIVLNDFTHDSRVLREAKALAERNYKVSVLAIYEKGLRQKESVAGIQVIRIPIKSRRILQRTNVRLIRYLEFMIRSFSRLRKIRPDTCHCHDLNTLPIGYLSRKFLNSHLIYDSHELESQKAGFQDEPRWLYWLCRRLEHFLITRADKVITVGDSIADYLVRQDGIERPLVVRNIPEATATGRETSSERHFGYDKNYRIVIYQGGLQVWRGIENIIRALEFLDKNIILVFIGDGPFREALENETARLNLSDRVVFKGWVTPDSLLRLTSQGDLGIVSSENVCLSYYYTLPSKFFEYITAGLPVGVSNFPDMVKIVKEYEIGETFDPSSPKDIARVIQSVFQDEAHYQTLKRNVTKARERLSWDKEKEKLYNLYKYFEERRK